MPKEYKTLTFIKNVVEKKFDIAPNGKLILFGVEDQTGSIQRLCSKWGADRVIGYDIEDRKHPNIKKVDLENMNPDMDCEISLADIDVGDWTTHSALRLEILHWCIPRMVKQGMILCTSPLASEAVWRDKGHDYLIKKGFKCHRFYDYAKEAWHRRMTRGGIWNPNATCIYRREN